MNLLLYPVILPIAVGLLLFVPPFRFKGIREGLCLLINLVTLYLAILLFLNKPVEWFWGGSCLFRLDNLSGFIFLGIGLFGALISLYSIRSMEGKPHLGRYYAYLLLTQGAAFGTAAANHLILLLVFWGFLGLTLYLLIAQGGPQAAPSAKKALIIIGGTDSLMILAVGIIFALTNSYLITEIHLELNSGLTLIAFFCLAAASLAKAGAVPLHTWIPASAEVAPLPVMAYLPAAIDKLLGIYLLARICLDLFELVPNSPASILLMLIGAVTIIFAVFMALIQHNLRTLLSYHAVSQVGYMVLGIGTGLPIGIAGGIFHMVNHAIYKACLFLSGGAVEKQTGTSDLDKLGGLATVMPISFVCCLIAALSISGIPPLNGFFSKWMVYQGLIELGRLGGHLWVIWLVAAMFGSALTLASFIKVLHAVYLGQGERISDCRLRIADFDESRDGIREVPFSMWLPQVVLAALCVAFGIFADGLPLKHLVLPAVGEVSYSGLWEVGLATGLIIIGLLLGGIIYLLGNIKGLREDKAFIGGETIEPSHRVTGTEFYETIKEIPPFKGIYRLQEKGWFDLYEIGKDVVNGLAVPLRLIHTGVLNTYLAWFLLGLLGLFLILN
ncbi:MAG: proton-conducting transporter membrane subunit [bacterium]|nr:proton-conducting transporter membrane subunit [bacterium]